MGASSSSERGPSPSPEQQQEESMAASTGSLPSLHSAFSKLSGPSAAIPISSLQEVFSLNLPNIKSESESLQVPENFQEIMNHLGLSIVSLFFSNSSNEINWLNFLKGFNQCSTAVPVSQSLNILYLLYSTMCNKSGLCLNLEFDLSEGEIGKVSGSFRTPELLNFIWMCWILMQNARILRQLNGSEKGILVIPDVTPLMLSLLVGCGVVTENQNIWEFNVLSFDKEIPVQKIQTWVLTTVSGLSRVLSRYVQEKIQNFVSLEGNGEASTSVGESNYIEIQDIYLLTRGRAWSISLSIRSALSEELLRASFFGMDQSDLLYRCSIHGKGLSRFWSNLEGYNGSVLILISASSFNAQESEKFGGNWVIGVLTDQGFENKDTYFGTSVFLFAIDPIFRVFSPSGKERNFIYCHLHPTIRVYEPNPKPVGLAFGGNLGNERISLDEDFAKITIRHHAVDKTYQPGSLIPNQGFLPVEGTILDIEVWGLGGEKAKKQQNVYKKREKLFSEQRRKVDLKTFANWEDSPEKMMMDMVSDPNKVSREDR